MSTPADLWWQRYYDADYAEFNAARDAARTVPHDHVAPDYAAELRRAYLAVAGAHGTAAALYKAAALDAERAEAQDGAA